MKELAYKISAGMIENPVITLEVNDESHSFSGGDAKVFAFGYLTGLRAAKQEVEIDDRTVEE